MILKGKVLIADKDIFEGTSQKTGKAYKFYRIYVKENGLVDRVQVNEMIYNKAEKEKIYEITARSNDRGNIEINDIEPTK